MDKTPYTRRFAVIGGGLAGLSAAHRLCELGRERHEKFEITLLESSSRLGGLVGTEQIGDYLVDLGADSFLTNKPAAVNLCRRLGIEDRLIDTDPKFRRALVLNDGRPVPIPDGFQLLSPTAVWPIITTPLFSAWGKFRLLLEWFHQRRSGPGNHTTGGFRLSSHDGIIPDECLTSFVLRHFGREAFERLIQPLVGGIYTADPDHLSLAATMPRFLEMERDHGSLIRASLFQKAKSSGHHPQPGERQSGAAATVSSGARYGLFAGLKGGMADLVQALKSRLESQCSIEFQSEVTGIETVPRPRTSQNDSNSVDFRLMMANGRSETFEKVVLATSASRLANLLRGLDQELSHRLEKIEYASSAIIVSGHQLADIRNPLHAFGLVIPHVERRRILAVSFSSRKFPDRAPADSALLRTFVGGALQSELLKNSDQELCHVVQDELGAILGVRGRPDFMKVVRYREAMPQYHVGHLDLVRGIEEMVARHPGLKIAGIACHGVGVPDAIASGERAAEQLCGLPSATLPASESSSAK